MGQNYSEICLYCIDILTKITNAVAAVTQTKTILLVNTRMQSYDICLTTDSRCECIGLINEKKSL